MDVPHRTYIDTHFRLTLVLVSTWPKLKTRSHLPKSTCVFPVSMTALSRDCLSQQPSAALDSCLPSPHCCIRRTCQSHLLKSSGTLQFPPWHHYRRGEPFITLRQITFLSHPNWSNSFLLDLLDFSLVLFQVILLRAAVVDFGNGNLITLKNPRVVTNFS